MFHVEHSAESPLYSIRCTRLRKLSTARYHG